jgi:Sulfatase-modifying factor enzyme 1
MPTTWFAAGGSLSVAQRDPKPANVSEPSSAGLLVASLCGLLTLTGAGCIGATAEEVVGQHSPTPTILTSSEETVKATTPGAEFRECASGCPVMIVIPPGKFIMGSSARELDHRAREDPRHEVDIAKPFAVSKFEVTFEQWDACVAASACVRAADAWGRGDMPVVNVSWGDVQQYVGWLSGLTGKEYRLLTEAEWEYAARGPAPTPVFPGAMHLARTMPTAATAAARGVHKPCRSDRSSRTLSAFMMCTATFGSGWKTVGMKITEVHRRTDQRGSKAQTRTIGSYAGAPGTMRANSSVLRFASNAITLSGLTPWAFGSPER